MKRSLKTSIMVLVTVTYFGLCTYFLLNYGGPFIPLGKVK